MRDRIFVLERRSALYLKSADVVYGTVELTADINKGLVWLDDRLNVAANRTAASLNAAFHGMHFVLVVDKNG